MAVVGQQSSKPTRLVHPRPHSQLLSNGGIRHTIRRAATVIHSKQVGSVKATHGLFTRTTASRPTTAEDNDRPAK